LTPPTPRLPPDELLNALLAVFGQRGFEGASLAELARASGRSKASLYHHFPGGKTEMIEHLVARCTQELEVQAFSHLRTEPGSNHGGKKKLAGKARSALADFVDGFCAYLRAQNGNCLLATLALTQPELLGDTQKQRLADWQHLLNQTCEKAGHKPKAARRLAHASLAKLYGSLTLAAMGSSVSIDQTGKWLKKELLVKP